MTIPMAGFLATHAMAVSHCQPWLALEAASKVFSAHASEAPTDANWVGMVVETVELIREYEADPDSHPELARLDAARRGGRA